MILPAPVLPYIAFLLIAVNVAMWPASVKRRAETVRRIPEVHHWNELKGAE